MILSDSSGTVGKKTATIRGIGNYGGSVTKTYKIVPKKINENNIKVYLTNTYMKNVNMGRDCRYCIYDKDMERYEFSVQVIENTVKHNNFPDAQECIHVENGLRENKDYTVKYDARPTKVGDHTIHIEGIGNYTGSIKTYYYIDPCYFNVDVKTPSNTVYSGKSITPTIKVTKGIYTLAKNKDYKVTYDKDTINAGTVKVTIDGIGNYIGTYTYSYKIEKKSISAVKVASVKNQKYTGKVIKPALQIKDGTKALMAGKDYTLTYVNNKKIGKATIKITGKGNYTGSKTVTFKIVK
jgi:hypothetical protein